MDWNMMARTMQRRPFFAGGSEEDIEAALKSAAGNVTRPDGAQFCPTCSCAMCVAFFNSTPSR